MLTFYWQKKHHTVFCNQLDRTNFWWCLHAFLLLYLTVLHVSTLSDLIASSGQWCNWTNEWGQDYTGRNDRNLLCTITGNTRQDPCSAHRFLPTHKHAACRAKNICFMAMHWQSNRLLIYVFRPQLLYTERQNPVTAQFLDDLGCPAMVHVCAVGKMRVKAMVSLLSENSCGSFLFVLGWALWK